MRKWALVADTDDKAPSAPLLFFFSNFTLAYDDGQEFKVILQTCIGVPEDDSSVP